MVRTLVILIALLTLTAEATAGERTKVYDDRNRQVGDIYDPGHGRRLQIRDNKRRIIGYIEKDGDITDSRRRKVGKIEDLIGGD